MASNAIARAVVRADNRKLKGDLNKSRTMFGRTFSKISKGVKGSLSMALSPLGVGAGALGLAAIGQEVLGFEESLTRIAIQANMSGKEADSLRASMLALGKESGLSRAELSNTATQLINLTGDIEFTKSSMKVLADANAATGASMEDLAGLAFSLKESFGLVNPEDLSQGLSAIITAGKEGGVPLGEMSLILQQLSASFKDVGGLGKGGAADLAAALQVLRPAFGSAAEAGTGLQSMMTALKKKSVDLAKNGIKVFEKDAATGEKTFRGLRAILDDIAQSPLAKDPAKLVKVLGRVEAEKAVKAWTEGRDRFEALADSARKSNAVQEDAAKFRESSSFKLKQSLNEAKEAFAQAFTPERIKMFAAAMEDLAKVLGFMVDHAAGFAAIWAALKISSLVSGFSAMAASTGVMSANTAKVVAGMGKIQATAGLIGAAVAGWQVGRALDEWLGISDAISDALTAETKDYQGNQGIRDWARDVNELSMGELSGGILYEKNTQKLGRRSSILMKSAQQEGLIGKDGAIDREKAFRVAHNVEKGSKEYLASKATGFTDDKTQALIDALERAAKVMEKEKNITVNATVNGETADVRRSPQ